MFLDWICPKYTKSYKKSLKTKAAMKLCMCDNATIACINSHC